MKDLVHEVARVLYDPPHDSMGLRLEEFDIRVEGGDVIIEWERTWSGSAGAFSGLLSAYYDFDHNLRDDGSGGVIRINGGHDVKFKECGR